MVDINDLRNEHLLAHPYFMAGVVHERERIIALLKPYIGWSGTFEADAADIIAHIKGENE